MFYLANGPCGAGIVTGSNNGLAPLVEGDGLAPLVEGVAGTGSIVVVIVVGCVFAAPFRI